MENTLSTELQQRLAELQAIFHAQLPAKIDQIKTGMASLGHNFSPEQLGKLHRMAHSLAGSGGTFGAHEVGTAARTLEQRLKALGTTGTPPDASTRQQLHSLLDTLIEAAEKTNPNPPTPNSTEVGHGKIFNILYIEDNPISLSLVSRLMDKRPNIRLQTTAEPLLGITMARSEPPDLILLNADHPGMDGYEVLSRLRADETTAKIPVIALSANTQGDAPGHGDHGGFVAHIGIPINEQELRQGIDRIVSSDAAQN